MAKFDRLTRCAAQLPLIGLTLTAFLTPLNIGRAQIAGQTTSVSQMADRGQISALIAETLNHDELVRLASSNCPSSSNKKKRTEAYGSGDGGCPSW